VNLALLAAAPLPVIVHVATVVPAFCLGLWQFLVSTKGSSAHRAVGTLYLLLMTATAGTALFVHTPGFRHIDLGPLQLSWIHLFIPLTLYGVLGSTLAVRRHDVAGHRRAMINTFVGALLIAGGFALSPGRIMHAVLFS